MTSPLKSPQETAAYDEVDVYLDRAAHLLDDKQSFMEARFILHKLDVTDHALHVELRDYTLKKLAEQFPERQVVVVIAPRITNCEMVIKPKG